MTKPARLAQTDPPLWWKYITKTWKASPPPQWLPDDELASSVVITALKQCCTTRDLDFGLNIHERLTENGLESHLLVANNLLQMYRRCGNLALADGMFQNLQHKDAVSWTCLIMGYVEQGEHKRALDIFTSMDCESDHVTSLAALRACIGLAGSRDVDKQRLLSIGTAIHKSLRREDFASNVILGNTLVEMYCKFGLMESAKAVFDNMIYKNAVSWTCFMMGYVENGQHSQTLEVFACMDCKPDYVTCLAVIKAYAGLACEQESEKERILERTLALHELIKRSSFESNITVANALVDMYSKCGDMNRAREAFERMPSPNTVSWNSLILGYVRNGKSPLALELFTSMDCAPDCITYVAAVKACTSVASEDALVTGLSVHSMLAEHGLDADAFVACALVDMYSKYEKMHLARTSFERVDNKDTALWNCLLMGYVDNGESEVALELFTCMDCKPNHVTFVAALKACTSLASERASEKESVLQRAVNLHENLRREGLDTNQTVANTLLDTYSRCGDMKLSRETFERMTDKNVVTWTCLITGYNENEHHEMALEMFESMDCEPDCFTYAAALKSCIGMANREKEKALKNGRAIHAKLKSLALDRDVFLAGCLVEMYSRCGETALARAVFQRMPHKDVVVYNSLLLGYVANGDSLQALELFTSMTCEPSPVTYIAALKACRSVAALQLGRTIHSTLCRLGLEDTTMIATALVDFYGRCGCMSSAAQVFTCMHSPNIVSWNALIAGHSLAGDTREVCRVVKTSREAGVQLDAITFVCVLIAFSRAGRLEEGEALFRWMHEYGLSPALEHYNCLVDMLSRANRVEEVARIMSEMPFQANKVTWSTLLSACREWSSLELGRVAFDALVHCKDRSYEAAGYVLYHSIMS